MCHLAQVYPNSITLEDIGGIDRNFVCVGLYYCSSVDQFAFSEFMIVDSVADPIGRTWRLVSGEFVCWMGEMIARAFQGGRVDDRMLSEGILKFYRVRDALEDYQRRLHSVTGGEGESGENEPRANPEEHKP